MSRLEFMKQLARLLDDLPREEKIDILKYYNGYFDDAGAENEAAIIEALGSPERVAAEVKAGMQAELQEEKQTEIQKEQQAEAQAEMSKEKTNREEIIPQAERFEYGTGSDADAGERDQTEKHADDPAAKKRSRRHGTHPWLVIAILAVVMMTFPVWIGLLGGLIGVLGSAIGVIVALVVGLIGALVGLVGGAVGCVVTGFTLLLSAPITGMLSLAVGIFLLGLMLLVGMLVGLIFGKIVPGIARGISKLVHGAVTAVSGIFDGIVGRG